MQTISYGKDAGAAFAAALQAIYSGKRAKLERIDGQWYVVQKGKIIVDS